MGVQKNNVCALGLPLCVFPTLATGEVVFGAHLGYSGKAFILFHSPHLYKTLLSQSGNRPKDSLNGAAEGRGIDCRVEIKPRLDRVEKA